MSINKVILIGNLGDDPEVKYLDKDRVVANIRLATNEYYTDKNGQKVTQTEWHNLEMWDELARIAEKYLKKGREIYIEGKIKTESWQDKDGNNRYTTRIRVNTLQMLRDASVRESGEQMQNKPNNMPEKDKQVSNTEIDDLPF